MLRQSSTLLGTGSIERRYRVSGSRRYRFVRITWADGSVTVRAYLGRSETPFREWTRCGMWTDPGYLSEGK